MWRETVNLSANEISWILLLTNERARNVIDNDSVRLNKKIIQFFLAFYSTIPSSSRPCPIDHLSLLLWKTNWRQAFLSVFVLVMIFVITLSKSLVLHVNPSDIIMCRRVSLVQYTIGHTIIGLHEVVIVKVAVNPLSSTRSRLVAENNLK